MNGGRAGGGCHTGSGLGRVANKWTVPASMRVQPPLAGSARTGAGVICLLHFLLAHCGESREKTPGVLPTVGIFPQCRELAEGSPTLADPRPRSEIILQFL
jgi:hypothetical protein